MAKFIRSDWSLGVASLAYVMLFLQVLSIISTAQLECLTVKIKEDFELVIEVRVFLRTIIKLVSCPVFAFS